MKYTVYAYATPKYYKFMSKLEKSLNKFKFDYKFDKLPEELPSKRRGSLMKPTMILSALESLESTILYVDADSVFEGIPKIPDVEFDVGIVKKDRNVKSGLSIWDHVSLFNYTEKSIHFLKVWKYLCDWREMMGKGDHKRLILTREILNGTYKEIYINKYVSGHIIGYTNNKKKYVHISNNI